jgi:hypothetical protein
MYDPREVSTVDELLPMDVLDLIFLFIFFVEMIVKTSAYGWFTTKKQKLIDEEADEALLEEAETMGLPPPPPLHPRYGVGGDGVEKALVRNVHALVV